MTCRQCRCLKDGRHFPRYARVPGGKLYISRRCRKCWWSRMDQVNPKNGVGK